jgi:hypothetical protein
LVLELIVSDVPVSRTGQEVTQQTLGPKRDAVIIKDSIWNDGEPAFVLMPDYHALCRPSREGALSPATQRPDVVTFRVRWEWCKAASVIKMTGYRVIRDDTCAKADSVPRQVAYGSVGRWVDNLV